MRSAARMRVVLVSMSRRRARRRTAEIWARLNRAAAVGSGGLAEQFEGIGVEVVECLQRGREVFTQRVSQPLEPYGDGSRIPYRANGRKRVVDSCTVDHRVADSDDVVDCHGEGVEP
ncbi:hypothetical protein P3H15_45580 [Rhodococcus sp. T2V]|uniref:hypothetical protein n=1 Tax=Rhodococcus sp. T2V TaxID=3034164 RepID=UPI0023E18D04|nr:hypothetical protein [Rhodococcus sp. T2V]MDF3312233.1 hypothetical protein [Rhodococcus sp. T2V]